MLELVDPAKEFSGITIILNHVGGPLLAGPYSGRREEVMEKWRQGIKAVAACPNVVVKFGGLGMPHCGFGWEERETHGAYTIQT
jgi:L-fuconolactonase